MKYCSFLTCLFFLMVLLSCKAVEEETPITEIPISFLGEWRPVIRMIAFLDSSINDSAIIAADAKTIDYSNSYEEYPLYYPSLLFVTKDSLVVMSHDCGGEERGVLRYAYPINYEDGRLLGYPLTYTEPFTEVSASIPLHIGNTVKMSTSISQEDSLLMVTQFFRVETYKRSMKYWIYYIKVYYHLFNDHNMKITDTATCGSTEAPMLFTIY